MHIRSGAVARKGMCLVILSLAAFSLESVAQQGLTLAQIRELPGKRIGHGSNRVPATDLGLYTYTLERLQLPREVSAKIDGAKMKVRLAWRLTISGEHFRVGAMPPVLLIDEHPVAIGQENPDQTEVSFIIFNPRFIRTGATLAITYEGDLLIDSRDPDLITADFSLPELEGAEKHLLPETMVIRNR